MVQVMLLGPFLSRLGSKKTSSILAKINNENLVFLKHLLEVGKVVPVTDRRYSLSDLAEALRYLGEGHARGKVVITVAHSNGVTALIKALRQTRKEQFHGGPCASRSWTRGQADRSCNTSGIPRVRCICTRFSVVWLFCGNPIAPVRVGCDGQAPSAASGFSFSKKDDVTTLRCYHFAHCGLRRANCQLAG
jgi:hypothetical protein